MDIPVHVHEFRLWILERHWPLTPDAIKIDIELYGVLQTDPRGEHRIYSFEPHRATVVSDISLSLAFAAVAHHLHVCTRGGPR